MKSLSVHVGMGTAISVLSNQMQGALLSYLLKILNTKFINALMNQMATFLLLDITAYKAILKKMFVCRAPTHQFQSG